MPNDLNDVFVDQFDVFEKGGTLGDISFDVLGHGLLNVNGDKWKQQRRAASHLFSTKSIRDVMEPMIREKTLQLRGVFAQCADCGQTVSMKSLLGKFTSDAFTRIGFGVELNQLGGDVLVDEMHPLDIALHAVQNRFQTPMWMWKLARFLNVGAEKRLRDNMKIVNDMVRDIRQRERQSTRTPGHGCQLLHRREGQDVFQSVVAHCDDESVPSRSAKDSRRDPISVTGAFNWRNRCANPRGHPQARVLGRSCERECAFAVRFHVSVHDSSHDTHGWRVHQEGDRGGRVEVRCSQTQERVGRRCCGIQTRALVRRSDRRAQDYHAAAIHHFQHGPRKCIGMRLAMLEMKTVMAVLFSRFDIETLEDPFKITYDFSFVLPVKGPLAVHVRDRTPPHM